MKKNNSTKRGPQDGSHQSAQPEKVGWVRKFCGKGIFREIWKNRYVVLKGDQLYISEKEVKDEKNIQEVFDLSDYEKCEELRKSKSRSKKNHSKFTLAHSRQPGNTAPNLIFLAVSPEEKESWINALNSAITRAKNRILDEVTVEEDSCLAHPTRDRAKIQHSRRPPTRGHLMAVVRKITSTNSMSLRLKQNSVPTEAFVGGLLDPRSKDYGVLSTPHPCLIILNHGCKRTPQSVWKSVFIFGAILNPRIDILRELFEVLQYLFNTYYDFESPSSE